MPFLCRSITLRLKTRGKWIRNWWTKINRSVLIRSLFWFTLEALTEKNMLLRIKDCGGFVCLWFLDTKYCILCGEPFGIELYLQYNIQLGVKYWLRKFFTHHLINNECKSHSFLPRQQHSGVCHRYVKSAVSVYCSKMSAIYLYIFSSFTRICSGPQL